MCLVDVAYCAMNKKKVHTSINQTRIHAFYFGNVSKDCFLLYSISNELDTARCSQTKTKKQFSCQRIRLLHTLTIFEILGKKYNRLKHCESN